MNKKSSWEIAYEQLKSEISRLQKDNTEIRRKLDNIENYLHGDTVDMEVQ